MMFRSLWVLILPFLGALSCNKSDPSEVKQETDDRPTPENLKLVDVTDRVNSWVNDSIRDSRLEVNPENKPWDHDLKLKLVNQLSQKLAVAHPGSGLGIHWKEINLEISTLTKIENMIITGLSEDHHEIQFTKFVDSRFGDNPIGITKAQFMSHVTTTTADHSISPVIRVNSNLIGVDKMGHFAEQGLWYFLAEKDGLISTPLERWQFGQFTEGDPDLDTSLHDKYREIYGKYCKTCVIFGGFGYYGMTSTGVCSYGDLMANEGGYQFYAHLYAAPDTYEFDLKYFDTLKWNEEVTPSKFKSGLKVRPAPTPLHPQ
jgi:hypothetical protein